MSSRILSWGVMAVVFVVVVAPFWWLGAGAGSPGEARGGASGRGADRASGGARSRPAPTDVLARVNGEVISVADVEKGLPPDVFGPLEERARKERLDRLVGVAALRQYLEKAGVKIPEERVDAKTAELKRDPPANGCSCCRFPSLEAFLAANLMTLDELRVEVRNGLGLESLVAKEWKVRCPGRREQDALIDRERKRLMASYVKLRHVFFNATQQRGSRTSPVGLREQARVHAAQAWRRIQAGQDLAQVARECSEDAFSKKRGGSLGCVQKGLFGRDAERVVSRLAPGECSGPVESPWGAHVFQRETMERGDMLQILKDEHSAARMGAICAVAQGRANVERPGR